MQKKEPYTLGRNFAKSSTIPSARNTLLGIFRTNGHTNPSLKHGVSDAKVFQLLEDYLRQVPITENQLGIMQMIVKDPEHVEMNYLKIPDSSFVAQPVNALLFPWEEARSSKNPSQ